MKYYKIFKKDHTHQGYKFSEGLNVDSVSWNSDADCKPGGFYFSDAENICEYLYYGSWICEVKVPEGIEVIKGIGKYKAHEIIIDEFRDLRKVDTWKWMINEGIDIYLDDNCALCWAVEHSYLELVKFLVENGADIHVRNNYALRWAAEEGHLDIVEFLVKRGADIHSRDNFALRFAAKNGHLDIVKFLVEQGADIHAQADYALRWAVEYGHLDIVKFLESLE
jgi:hypothetical protein